MIKIKSYKKGYCITFTKWEGEYIGTNGFELAITDSEAKALYLLLKKKFGKYE